MFHNKLKYVSFNVNIIYVKFKYVSFKINIIHDKFKDKYVSWENLI